MQMKMLLISDLHLEFRNNIKSVELMKSKCLVPDIDVVLNAGDTHPSSLMRDYFAKDISAYHAVMGNHDYYGSKLEKCRWSIEYEGVKIVGCTLWTDWNNWNPMAIDRFNMTMSDSRMIKPSELYLDQDIKKIHKRDLQYIADHKPDVVMTHHAPSLRSIHPKYRSSGDLNYSFVSDLDKFILKHSNIKYWFHGHVHDPWDYMIGNCRVIANPLGYPGETSKRDEDYEGVIVEI